jgi:hypothetical protein
MSSDLTLNVLEPGTVDAEGVFKRKPVLVVSVDAPLSAMTILPDPNSPYFPSVGHHLSVDKKRRWLQIIHGDRLHILQDQPIVDPQDNYDTRTLKYISRDGGVSWDLFLENIPGDLYYLGNPLHSKEYIL